MSLTRSGPNTKIHFVGVAGLAHIDNEELTTFKTKLLDEMRKMCNTHGGPRRYLQDCTMFFQGGCVSCLS